MPLGLFSDAAYTLGGAVLPPNGTLLLFTDGLPDSIAGENGEDRLREAVALGLDNKMHLLVSLIDPHFNEDDVTILLVTRSADVALIGSIQ